MLEIRLIGRPEVSRGTDSLRPRGRKSWAVLCYLLLGEDRPSRRDLSSLLFSEADDPLRALRWSLSEIRRLLGPDSRLDGDPLSLQLPENTQVDARLITVGRWQDAIKLPGLGQELLAGFNFDGSPHFESWLLTQQRHIAAATEDVLREACLAYLARGEPTRAIPVAVSLVGINPFVENHQALLIRSYALSGDSVAAEQQLQACTALYQRELGTLPGPAIRMAASMQPQPRLEVASDDAIWAAIESGNAAIAAGAVEAGLNSLRLGLALADSGNNVNLGAQSRLSLAEALVHSVRGRDDEGAELLHWVAEVAQASGMEAVEARARVELGYTDMLAGRYDRAEGWLMSGKLTAADPETRIKAVTYMGVVESDRARYGPSRELLDEAVRQAHFEGLLRREAYAVSMLGRLSLLIGDLDQASELLTRSIDIAESDSWLAFLPWPQAFLGEVLMEQGNALAAGRVLRQAYARACQIGDPCWEGVTGRGLALLAEAAGDSDESLRLVQDALERCRSLPDTYKWAEAHVLEAQCRLGLAHNNDAAAEWIAELFDVAARTGMRELQSKAMAFRVQANEGLRPTV